MYPFLFLGHTSLNYVYAEHRQRELLAEPEHERRVAQNRASASRRAAVLSVVRAGFHALLPVPTRISSPSSSPDLTLEGACNGLSGREPRPISI
jgi:hypothetical protein